MIIPGDFIQGLFWLAIGVAAVLFSSRYGMGTLSEVGPGALPFGLGLIFIFLSVLLIIRSWRKAGDARLPFGSRYVRVLFVIGILVAGTFFLESIGYLLAIFLLIVGSMLVLDRRRWMSALLLGFASSAGSYLLFHVWLNVPLPTGWLYF
jgi:hypothetical protein